ncbi:hypothetical protein SAMN05421642_11143 [Rhodococcoides kyotonense]|uniref:Uncharacterized protein n=1 Tax=Rhodococcoides kyotonense TaxID=398843 RepID=A0A239KRB8_9NOCA|nr:hypothetical protein SAMN05421642_11143 [Rhodococcus kyotonensis]
MTLVLIFLMVLAVMHLAVVRGFAPDTHAEVSQFGDYRF